MPLTGLTTGARGYGLFGASGPSGAFDSISTVTAAGGETSFTFSSIPSTYVSLQFRIFGKTTASGAGVISSGLQVRFNGSTTGYARHEISGTGSLVGAFGITSESFGYINGFFPSSNTSNTFGSCILDIHNYGSSTQNKTSRAFFGFDTNTTSGFIYLSSFLWANTSAVTSVTFTMDNGTAVAGSTFSLYGLRGAA